MSARRLRCLAPVVAGLALAMLTAGCSLSREAPVKNTYLLDPRLPAATVRIGNVNVASPYRDRAFVYRTGDLQYESDFYHEFFIAPASMIAQSTVKALEASRLFARVVPSGSAPEEGDFVLEAFVSDLYADARGKPAQAVVGVSFYLTRTTYPASVVWSKSYVERTPLGASTPDALAVAWNESLGRVYAQLVRDLGELPAR